MSLPIALMTLLCAPAHAQDVVYWDFDSSIPDYWGYTRTFLTASPFPNGGSALANRVELGLFSYEDVDGVVFIDPPAPDEWILTHTSLAMDLDFRPDYYYGNYNVIAQVYTDGPDVEVAAQLGALGPIDTSALCGLSAHLYLRCSGAAFASYTPSGSLVVDNIRGTGPVCAGFTDADADGLCPNGVDLDGDGTCIDDGELTPHDVQDCDDAVLGPTCLSLSVSPATQGSLFEATVTGARPGERVRVLWSLGPGTSCPPELGGVCVDLDSARPFGGAIADADGTAVVSRTLSATAPSGTERWFAAVVERPGFASDRSAAVQVVLP